MLDLDRTEMTNTVRSAVLSAELLRQGGELARAKRLESLARILARELERTGVRSSSDQSARGTTI